MRTLFLVLVALILFILASAFFAAGYAIHGIAGGVAFGAGTSTVLLLVLTINAACRRLA